MSVGEFKSIGIGLEPGLKFRLSYSILHLDLFAGVQLDFNTSFQREGKADPLQFTGITEARPKWFGVRTGLQLGVHW